MSIRHFIFNLWKLQKKQGISINRKLKRLLKRLQIQAVLTIVLIVSVIIILGTLRLARADWVFETLTPDEWGSVEALATLATFAFAVGAGLLVLFEFMETSDGRNLEIYRDIYEKFMNKEQIDARRFIYRNIPDKWSGEDLNKLVMNYELMSPEKLHGNKQDSPEERSAKLLEYVRSFDPKTAGEVVLEKDQKTANDLIKSVLNAIDYFGFLLQQDWVTEDEMIGWVSPIVVKIWEKIGLLVAYEVEQRKNEPDYYEAAVELAQKCFKWREENIPERMKKRGTFTNYAKITEFDDTRI